MDARTKYSALKDDFKSNLQLLQSRDMDLAKFEMEMYGM